MDNISVIIVAAGKGLRMGSELPKQFLAILGKPILCYTLENIRRALPTAEIILALHPDYVDFWKGLCEESGCRVEHKIVEGGDTRFASVRNCVDAVSPLAEKILIHDGVRPFINSDIIYSVVEKLDSSEAVVPIIDMVDSLRLLGDDGKSEIIDRSNIKAVQTPQGFIRKSLMEGYEQEFDNSFTDDASVVEKNGSKISFVAGFPQNIKITTKFDIDYAIFLLKSIVE